MTGKVKVEGYISLGNEAFVGGGRFRHGETDDSKTSRLA